MRFELAGATLRFSGGSGSKSNLRRQRTLVSDRSSLDKLPANQSLLVILI